MAMSASLTIVNATGATIMFTQVSKVNDDSTWSAPSVGTSLDTGDSTTIAMGNSSVFFAPQGVGANVYFVCQSNFQLGQIYFDDPAVGEHSFKYGNTAVFSYDTTNSSGNSYTVTVTLA